MITQVIQAYATPNIPGNEYCLMAHVDDDGIFWVGAYEYDPITKSWSKEYGSVSYQRDETIVRDIRHDPDVKEYFAGQGFYINKSEYEATKENN